MILMLPHFGNQCFNFALPFFRLKWYVTAFSNIPSDSVAIVKNNLGVNIGAYCSLRGTDPAIQLFNQSCIYLFITCLLPQHIPVYSTWTHFRIFPSVSCVGLIALSLPLFSFSVNAVAFSVSLPKFLYILVHWWH